MLFYSFFKTLIGKPVTVELKNDLVLTGTLDSIDQYLNLKLAGVHVVDEEKYPHLLAVKNMFIRGSVIRYVNVPSEAVDTELLQDATRREMMHAEQQAQLQSNKANVAAVTSTSSKGREI